MYHNIDYWRFFLTVNTFNFCWFETLESAKIRVMKIGIFTDSYLPTPSGVAVSVETFRRSLEEAGNEVFIFAPDFKNYQDKISNVFRFPSFFLPIRKDAPIVLPIIDSKFSEIEKIGLDVIHTMHFFTIGSLGQKVAKKINLPLIHTYHTNYEEYVKKYIPLFSQLAKKYIIRRSRNYCNSCDLIISPSTSMAKKIKGYGITTKIKSLPTGISKNNYRTYSKAEFCKKYNIRNTGKLLLFVGRLGEEKNLKFLLKAFEKVQKKIDSNLVFVGSGPLENVYKKIVEEKKIKDKVFFLGFLPNKEVYQIYGACDLFAFPSITETQGIVIVEAMARRLVTVAINKMGPSDIITSGKDGILTELNLEEYSEALAKVLTDDKLRGKLSEGAKETAKKYNQENITKQLLYLYQQAKIIHKQNR